MSDTATFAEAAGPAGGTGAVRLALLSLPVIVLGVNALAVLAIEPFALLVIEPSVQAQIDKVTAFWIVGFLAKILPFFLLSTVLAALLVPLFRAFWNARPASEAPARARRLLLGAPVFIALMTGSGWVMGALGFVVAGPFLVDGLGLDYFVQNLAQNAVLAGFSFVVSYYGAEVAIRRVLVPRLFRESEVLAERRLFSLSIASRLVVFAVAVGLVPGIMFTVAIDILNAGGDNYTGRDIMPVLGAVLAVLALLVVLITWAKALSIQKPLLELRDAAAGIGEGRFETRVTVAAADEIGALGGAFNEMARGLEERERIRGLFGKAVDPRVRDRLIEGSAAAAGETRTATVVFFDLAGFTSLTESLSADRVVSLLNLYFEAVTSCVEAEGGLVNKFIGDGVLAVFGVPAELTGHPDRALRAVEALGRKMGLINHRLESRGHRPLRFRAGVHTGEVLAGVVGARERLEYTVIGDAVNVASRLEPLGKSYGVDVVVSRATADACSGGHRLRPLGMAEIRGRSGPIEVFALEGPG